MKNRDENAKSPDWQVPTNLPGVAPEDYDASIDSGRGSAHSKGQVIKPQRDNSGLSIREQKRRGQYPAR